MHEIRHHFSPHKTCMQLICTWTHDVFMSKRFDLKLSKLHKIERWCFIKPPFSYDFSSQNIKFFLPLLTIVSVIFDFFPYTWNPHFKLTVKKSILIINIKHALNYTYQTYLGGIKKTTLNRLCSSQDFIVLDNILWYCLNSFNYI